MQLKQTPPHPEVGETFVVFLKDNKINNQTLVFV